LDSRLGLPLNTVLDGSYRITRVVGSGGFGITYEAEDINLATLVAIKEYYPFDFGDRDATMSVRPKSDRHRQTFDWGRSNFLQEARTLARFEHPSIVRVTRVFEANSTAYMVMRFEQGPSFETWLSELGRPPTQDELDAIVAPLLDALQMMHAADFLHRDIAPDNIIVRADGTPVLLDFGAARRAVAEMSRTLTGIVKAGYSPHEQYSSNNRLQGPWSDLYALGGTLYRAVTGHPPEEATLRVDEDHMPTAVQAAWKGRYRQGFLAGIDACLRVRHADRPRSVAELRPMLFGKGSVSKPKLERLADAFKSPSRPGKSQPRAPSRPPAQTGRTRRTAGTHPEPQTSRRWPAIAAALVAIVGGAYGGYEFTRWQPESEAEAAGRRAIEAQRQADAAAAKKKAEEEARQLEERIAAEKRAAEERVRQEEAKRQADAAAARKRAEEERARQEEAKRQADAAAAKKKADEEALARRQREERQAAEERARQEEAKRQAEAAAAAKRKADEEALARRQREERQAAEERARQEEAKRQAEAAAAAKKRAEEAAAAAAAAKKKAEETAAAAAAAAAAQKAEEERIAAERREAAERAQREAEAAAAARKKEEERIAALQPPKTATPERAAETLDADQRAIFIKRVQEVLKDSHCYNGAINGSSDAAQKSLDRFVKTAQEKGKDKPARIELAKATASDFDAWLRDADGVKSGLCEAPKAKAPTPPRVREPRPPRTSTPRSSPPSSGGGGGNMPIQGVR
jgi:serine/threonine protein kinase